MDSVLLIFWTVTAVAAVIGAVPFAISLGRCALKKQWKKVGLHFAAVLVLGPSLWALANTIRAHEYSKYLSNIFGANVTVGAAVFEYDTPRSFQGDGFSLVVYEAPESVRVQFENPDDKFTSEYPKRPLERKDWLTRSWSKAPITPENAKYIRFALSEIPPPNSGDFDVHTKAIREALSHGRAYYSFFYNEPNGNLGDIDFFIVDLEGNRVYLINQNT